MPLTFQFKITLNYRKISICSYLSRILSKVFNGFIFLKKICLLVYRGATQMTVSILLTYFLQKISFLLLASLVSKLQWPSSLQIIKQLNTNAWINFDLLFAALCILTVYIWFVLLVALCCLVTTMFLVFLKSIMSLK